MRRSNAYEKCENAASDLEYPPRQSGLCCQAFSHHNHITFLYVARSLEVHVMAERRMFSKSIVETDKFYSLPPSAQALYFHLSMHADDDGFLSNARSIQVTVGAKPDDLKLLLTKGYLISFADGLVVIRHWLLNNYLRSDRYNETTHTDEKKMLLIRVEGIGKARKVWPYELKDECFGIPNGNQMVAKMDTQYSAVQDRAGNIYKSNKLDDPVLSNLDTDLPFSNLDGYGDHSEEMLPSDPAPIFTSKMYQQQIEPNASIRKKRSSNEYDDPAFLAFWKVYPRHDAKQTAYNAMKKLHPSEELLSRILEDVQKRRSSPQWLSEDGKYIPLASSYLKQKRWEDEGTLLSNNPAKYVPHLISEKDLC